MASGGNPWGGNGNAVGKKTTTRLGGSAPTLSDRVGETFGRTKEVASVGYEKTKGVASVGYEKTKVAAKKVKEGASVGFHWIKVKYNKSKLFQKK